MARYLICKMAVSSFRRKMTFSSSIWYKRVLLMCNGWWISFDNDFKMKIYFECYMFFCTMIEEDGRHVYITCLITNAIWFVISQIWASLTRNVCHLLYGFPLMLLQPCTLVNHIRWCLAIIVIGGCGIISLRSGFLFDGFRGVLQQLCKLKVITTLYG